VNVAVAPKIQRNQPWNPKVLERVVFAGGHNIFSEGMRGRRAFVVERGAVSIWTGGRGQNLELERLGPCCIFGELALIIEDAPRSANATAMEETTCLVIKDYEFRRKLDDADAFVRALVRILAQNLRQTNRHIFSLAEPRSDARR
jgi:CRP-like cAMP-binding protein